MEPDSNTAKYPLVSVITVNFNHSDVTCLMLESLFQISYPTIEVIVIDNGSPDDNPIIIKEKFPQVTYMETGRNLGFAGANNLGILASKGKYILLLNNDTIVPKGFLEPLVAKMESDPMIGAVSPKIKLYFHPGMLQYTGITDINPYTGRSYSRALYKMDEGQFDEDMITAYAHGAAMMVSRKVLEEVGLMNTTYFLYYEELDLGYRIREAGYKIWYVHNSEIFHKESISTGKHSPQKTYYINRSRFLYLRRNVKGTKFILTLLFQLLFSIPKNSFKFLLQRRFDLFIAYMKAIGWQIGTIGNRSIHSNPTMADYELKS
ncbi:MAG: glycosyltransferase family 2 protein [Bacteroidales bacterium]|nr:glycosyltransferase family 2 protein [Bacteroidales bacterium]